MDIRILFENDEIVAVDKPEGLAAIPESSAAADCLLSLLQPRYPEKLYVVHRLDKEASGVMLFARHPTAHRHLNDQFASRQVHKIYAALLLGKVNADGGVIEKPLRQFGSGRMGVDEQRGKPSRTTFHVRQRFSDHTLVEARPETGRRHQLRIHLYSIGHAIAGDLRYGDRLLARRFPRLMLHAESIACVLASGLELVVVSPPPDSFQTIMAGIISGN